MSKAEELLDSIPETSSMMYTASPDTEPHIIINADRTVIVPDELKHIAVQGDHNIETVTFDCPRYWDEHDLSAMNMRINYQRPDGHREPHPVENLRIDDINSDMIHFDWTISGNVTEVKGNISFMVCAKIADDEGIVDREWHSRLNQDLVIDEGLDCSGDEIVERNPDILESILVRLDSIESAGGGNSNPSQNPNCGFIAQDTAPSNTSVLWIDTSDSSSNSSQNVTLTTEQINALDGMFKVCAFIKADVSAEYAAFQTAFGISGGEEEPDTEKTLATISATYGGGDVVVGTDLNDLTGIVVTAHYSDGTSQAVTGYTLSGTIAEGSNTVTVTYQGKTATFAVTGVVESGGEEPATPFGVAWKEGVILSKAEEVANATWVTSDYIDVTGKQEIKIYNETGKLFTFQGHFYTADKICPDPAQNAEWGFGKQYVQGSTAYPSPLSIPIKDGAKYVRLSTSIQSGSASAGYVRYDALTYELA